jgi:hypothetical protein
MRKMPYAAAVLTLGVWGSVLALSAAFEATARVVILPTANTPITLDAIRVTTGPSRLAFTATNAGPKKVTAYSVSVFWFPPAGQRHGFMSQEQQPSTSLGTGEVQKAVMPLFDRMPLGPETTLIVAVRSATFDDGTEWKHSDLNGRVDEKARELKLP